jgi:hypothetical protein
MIDRDHMTPAERLEAIFGSPIQPHLRQHLHTDPPMKNHWPEKRVIVNCDRDPYLIRWYILRWKRVGLFLHKFIRSDEDRALHDHPWAFLVIPIWRGYHEHSVNGVRRVWPLIGARFRPATYRHRVELIGGRPSWSLFIRFRRLRDWGFWNGENFTQWADWWRDKCE